MRRSRCNPTRMRRLMSARPATGAIEGPQAGRLSPRIGRVVNNASGFREPLTADRHSRAVIRPHDLLTMRTGFDWVEDPYAGSDSSSTG